MGYYLGHDINHMNNINQKTIKNHMVSTFAMLYTVNSTYIKILYTYVQPCPTFFCLNISYISIYSSYTQISFPHTFSSCKRFNSFGKSVSIKQPAPPSDSSHSTNGQEVCVGNSLLFLLALNLTHLQGFFSRDSWQKMVT